MTDLTLGITTCNRPDAITHCLDAIEETVTVAHETIVVDGTLDPDLRPDYSDYPGVEVELVDEFLSPAGAHQRLLDRCDTRYHHTMNDDMTPRPGSVEALFDHVRHGEADVATGICYDPDGPRPIGSHYSFDDVGGRPVVSKAPIHLESLPTDATAVEIDHGEPMYLADTKALDARADVGFDPSIDFLLDQWDWFLSLREASIQVEAVLGAGYDHHEYEYERPSPGAQRQDMWTDRAYFYEKWGYWPGVS